MSGLLLALDSLGRAVSGDLTEAAGRGLSALPAEEAEPGREAKGEGRRMTERIA